MINTDPNLGSTTPQVTDVSSLFNFENVQKSLAGIAKTNADILSTLGGMDIKAMEVARSFGVGQENALGIKQAIIAARDDVFKLGGNWKDLFDNQIATSNALGRNVTLSVEGQRELFAASKVANKSVGDIVGSLKDVGISAYDAGDAMGKVVNAAREQGVSAQKVSEMVLKNVSSMNQYNFRDGVEGLSKMAAQAVSMRIDMKTILDVAEKVFDPKGAIEMAASLQRLGVTQSELLDPLSLMNMAENDPAELQNQIAEMSKQFVQMNEKGQFEILPGAKRQMRELSKTLFGNTETLGKMALASAEAEEKMKRIQFPSFVNEEQKKMLANLAEMKEGRMMITVNGEEMELDKALANASKEGQEGINKLLEATKPKTVEQLAESQLDVLQQINSGINLLSGVVPAAVARTKTGEKIVRGMGSTIKEGSTKVLSEAGGTVGISNKLNENVLKPLENLNLKDTINYFKNLDFSTIDLGKGFDKLKDKIDKMGGGNLSTELITTFKDFSEKLKTIFVEDAIISPGLGTFKTLKEDDIYVGTGLSTILDKLTELKSVPNNAKPLDIITNIPKITTEKETIKTETKTTANEMKIDLNINVTAPPQIDTNEIVKVFKDQLVIQQLIQRMEQVAGNNNLTKTPK